MNLEDKLLEAHKFWTTMKGDVIVDGQTMFPNCIVKYNKCCTDDKEFWDKLDSKVKDNKPKLQPFRIKDVTHPNFDWCASSRWYLDNNRDNEFAYEYAVIEREVRLP